MTLRWKCLFLSLVLGSDRYLEAFSFSEKVSSSIKSRSTVRQTATQICATTISPTGSDIWWKEGLKFGCTACGRCCQNEGEVWLDADEFADLSTNLKEDPKSVLDKYAEKTMSGWVKMKNQVSDDPKVNDRCIFLGEDGKQCSIYESRPIQCRTYPFWPRLLSTSEEWSKEAVQPDTVPLEEGSSERHWAPSTGGCEGFTNPLATQINTRTIHRNHELYKMYTDVFPFLGTGDDENRLLAKTSVIQGVTKATTAWVEDFVLKYKLCPFAEHVFVTGGIRYRVFLGTDKKKIIERLKYEMLALLTAKEDDVATTLLMLPFAYQNFEDFYELSLDLEDLVLPAIEKESQGPREVNVVAPKRKSLLQKKLDAKNSAMIKEILDENINNKNSFNANKVTSKQEGGMGSMSFGGHSTSTSTSSRSVDTTENVDVTSIPVRPVSGCPINHSVAAVSTAVNQEIEKSKDTIMHLSDESEFRESSQPFREKKQDDLPEIQLAFFHPMFMWSGTEYDEPLNYEKRAPFPTINLLRAGKIREYTSEAKYKKIANSNVASLEKAGSETLQKEFDAFFKLAVEGA